MTFAKKLSISATLLLFVVIVGSVTYALVTQPKSTVEIKNDTPFLPFMRSGEPARIWEESGISRAQATEPLSQEACAIAKEQSDFFVDDEGQLAHYIKTIEEDDEERAAQLRSIACRPQALWVVDASPDIAAQKVSGYLSRAQESKKAALVVLYSAPSEQSLLWRNGVTQEAYLAHIEAIAKALAAFAPHETWLVLEPDALATAQKYNDADKQARLAQLKHATDILKNTAPHVRVYIDAGHSAWLSQNDAATMLTDAGIARADGFSLNVSNYQFTETEAAYAKAIAGQVHKTAVIDVSRNGNGPGSIGEWCNVEGRALGTLPQKTGGLAYIDALLWIKPPAESDGECNGGPKEGTLWIEYAQALLRNAQ